MSSVRDQGLAPISPPSPRLDRSTGGFVTRLVSSAPASLFRRAIPPPLHYRKFECDVGLVQRDALTIDEAGTADAWLANFDARRDEIDAIFERTYGRDARRWRSRWRTFFLAVSELFGFDRGREWFVAHYLLDRRTAPL